VEEATLVPLIKSIDKGKSRSIDATSRHDPAGGRQPSRRPEPSPPELPMATQANSILRLANFALRWLKSSLYLDLQVVGSHPNHSSRGSAAWASLRQRSNHRPILVVVVAQHGSLDDRVYVHAFLVQHVHVTKDVVTVGPVAQ